MTGLLATSVSFTNTTGVTMLTSRTFIKEKPKSPKLCALRARNFGLLGFGARCEYAYFLHQNPKAHFCLRFAQAKMGFWVFLL